MARTKTFNPEVVLDKAVDLFWAKGYYATSASDLVKELGLSRSSLYDTYGDKRSLFIKSLNRYREKIVGEVLSLVNNSTDFKETIKQIFDLVIEQDIDSRIPKGCFMVNSSIELSSEDQEIAKIVKSNQQDIEMSLEKLIQKEIDEKKISAEFNSKSLSKFFYNSISGIRVVIKYEQNRDNIDQIVALNLKLISL